ncbi:MAG: TerD family protein [Lachnospiraceae bacterium]|nr:TerD family protein [Lachnospiraceae bacterium]
MSVNLQKGQKVSLTKENPNLTAVVAGLGWDEVQNKGMFGARSSSTAEIDCDASAILLKGGRYVDRKDVVYFANLTHKSGAVKHMGDNLTGAGDGDDEQIYIDLSRVPVDYDKIVIVVNIYAAEHRKQHFGMIENAFIRLVNAQTGKELIKYNLTEDYNGKTALVFGEIYRYKGEWKFNAIGNGTNDFSIMEVVNRFK